MLRLPRLVATECAFALLRTDTATTWGHPALGGDNAAVREQLRQVEEVVSTTLFLLKRGTKSLKEAEKPIKTLKIMENHGKNDGKWMKMVKMSTLHAFFHLISASKSLRQLVSSSFWTQEGRLCRHPAQ